MRRALKCTEVVSSKKMRSRIVIASVHIRVYAHIFEYV